MRLLKRRIGFWLGLLAILVTMQVRAQGVHSVDAFDTHIEYSKLSTDTNRETHWSTEKMPWNYWFSNGRQTTTEKADAVHFYRLDGSLDMGLHRAPRKQYLVILHGTLQIEASDGEIRQFPPGSIVLVSDAEPNSYGHKTKVLGNKDVIAVVVPLSK